VVLCSQDRRTRWAAHGATAVHVLHDESSVSSCPRVHVGRVRGAVVVREVCPPDIVAAAVVAMRSSPQSPAGVQKQQQWRQRSSSSSSSSSGGGGSGSDSAPQDEEKRRLCLRRPHWCCCCEQRHQCQRKQGRLAAHAGACPHRGGLVGPMRFTAQRESPGVYRPPRLSSTSTSPSATHPPTYELVYRIRIQSI
jgi:hypothetical protein